jgi:hypothetical protein
MSKRFRMTIVWLAAGFVLAGSAVGFATVGDNHGSDVSSVAKPTSTPPTDHGKTVSDAAKNKEENESSDGESGERKLNHGFYVSAAAHCEDVDDPNPEGEDFTAPEDCDSDGQAHGEYVRGVAKSSVGKPDKGNPNDGS